MELGDWRSVVGDDFSGSGEYSTVFTWDPEKDCLIDLGEVKYTCELKVNDCSFGVKVMHPYRFFIPKEALKEKNSISIRITNSCANAFYHTKSFEAYERWQLTSYIDIEEEYLPDSLAGGLIGKVRLFPATRK